MRALENAGEHRSVRLERLALGVTLIVIGGLLTLELAGWVSVGRMQALWPLFLVVPGLFRLALPERRRSGALMLGMGLIFLTSTLRLARLHQLWPLFIVVGGVSMVAHAWERRS